MFDWVTKVFKKKTISTDTPDYPYLDVWEKQSKPDRHTLIENYKGVAYACANLNAQGVIKPTLRLYRKATNGSKCRWESRKLGKFEQKLLSNREKLRVSDSQRLEELADHPLLTLLNQPNGYADWVGFLELTQLFQEIVGSAYWQVVKNPIGIPVELWLLCPQHLKTLLDDNTGRIVEYQYGTSHIITLTSDQVLAFHLPNPARPWCEGLSPLAAVFETINTANKLSATIQSILDNEGMPSAVLTVKEGIGKTEAERLERSFNAKFRQSGSGSVVVFPEDATLTPLTFSPRDMSWFSIHETSRTMICNAYGVPPGMISEDGTTQYNVDLTLKARHVEDAVVPRLRRIQSILNRFLVPLFDPNLFLVFDDPSPQNREMRRADLELLSRNGSLEQNELRGEFGFELTTWGNERTGQSFITGNTSEVSTAREVAQVETQETQQDIEVSPALTLNGAQISAASTIVQQVSQGLIPRDSGIGQLEVLLNLSTEQAERIMGSVGHIPTVHPTQPPPKCQCETHTKASGHTIKLPQGAELAKVVKKFFKSQLGDVLNTLGGKKAGALPKKFIPMKKWNRELYKASQPVIELYYKDAYKNTSANIVKRSGVSNEVFNVTSPYLSEQINNLALHFCEETNATTTKELNKALEALREEIEEGLIEGDRMSELTTRVQSVFESAEKERAELIAQTEASRSHHEAQRQSAKDSGVVKGFKLLISSEACELCQSLATQEIGLDDYFYKDDTAPEEYQDRLVPVHPGCQCAIEEILDIEQQEETQEEETQEEEKPVATTQEEWIEALTEEEYQSVKNYTNVDWERIRLCQNENIDCTDYTRQRITLLNTALQKAPKYEGVVYRGLAFDNAQELNTFLHNVQKGGLTDKGFLSTSADRKVAESFMGKGDHRVLLLLKGRSGVRIDKVSQFRKEKEILFAPTTFKPLLVNRAKNGGITITLEEEAA